MKYTYDWEFLEDGRTIEPISVGVVAEDGREFYAINKWLDWGLVYDHIWLRDNVLRHLPGSWRGKNGWMPDFADPAYLPMDELCADILAFLRVDLAQGQDAELWAYYPAYDHVCLCQLWGPMVNKPWGVPMRTSCLAQQRDTVERLALLPPGGFKLPDQDPATCHHALWDARHDRDMAKALGVWS